MTLDETLFSVDHSRLEDARKLCHAACQWPSKAARANLIGEPDDSHSNLGWDDSARALVSHPLDSDGRFQIGFSFLHQSTVWIADGAIEDRLTLVDHKESSVESWIDAKLVGVGLTPTKGTAMPYELAALHDYSDFKRLKSQVMVLAAWYAHANTALQNLVGEFLDDSVSPVSIRCWPHHFDIATLFVLEPGDPETSKSIGVGLSPGDENYAEPYFYCSPWPASSDLGVNDLPHAPGPLTWHSDGFVSLIAPTSSLNVDVDLDLLLKLAFRTARVVTGIESA